MNIKERGSLSGEQ